MNKGFKRVNFPVGDLTAAKRLMSAVLGVEPYLDTPNYVGFRVDELEFGLDPNGHTKGITGAEPFWEVDDINATIDALKAVGATLNEDARDVGGGRLVASIHDADGNTIGLIQEP